MSSKDKAFLEDMARKTKQSMSEVMNAIIFHGKDAFYKKEYLTHLVERKYLMEFFHLTEDDVKDKDFELLEYLALYLKMTSADETVKFHNKVYAEVDCLFKEYLATKNTEAE
jgi:hypothetical protein